MKFAYRRQCSGLGLAWLEYSRIDEQCKLVIQPGNAPGFIVFADCSSDAETVISRKIRKGKSVSVRGRFASYGSKAVCLIDCRLMPEGNLEQLGTLKKRNKKRHFSAKGKT
jgi:hypothetical protein